MSGWIKGSRCGVDNCPSRFYRLISGQSVCQNGHVKEGIETAADDDDFTGFGRRIRIPREQEPEAEFARLVQNSKTEENEQIVHGIKAQVLAFECLQDLLRYQISWLIKTKHLPAQLESIARQFWVCFLAKYQLQKGTILQLTAVCYASCLAVKAPIFISDFLQWIARWEFPYMEAVQFVDEKKLARLPPVIVQIFRPMGPPEHFRLHSTISSLLNVLGDEFACEFPSPPWQVLAFKATRDLLLPPQVYSATIRILKLVEFNTNNFKRTRQKRHVKDYPEIQVYCAVIAAAKLCYGLDTTPRIIPPGSVAADHPDWGVWRDLIRKVFLLEHNYTRADERLVQFWDNDDIDDYVQWYRYHFGRDTPVNGGDSSTTYQRMLSMFKPRRSFPDERPTIDHPDADGFKELNALLYSVVPDADLTQRPEPSGAADNRSPEELDDRFPLAGPGSTYKIWSTSRLQSDTVLPELTDLFFNVISHIFIGAPQDVLRSLVETLERQLRTLNASVYDVLEREKSLAFVSSTRSSGHHWRKKNKDVANEIANENE